MQDNKFEKRNQSLFRYITFRLHGLKYLYYFAFISSSKLNIHFSVFTTILVGFSTLLLAGLVNFSPYYLTVRKYCVSPLIVVTGWDLVYVAYYY